MIAKRLQLLLVVTLALSISIFALGSTAYAQTTQTLTAVDQDVVRVLEGNWQTLAPGAQHWYRFDYAGGNQPVRISLDVRSAGSASFQVLTTAQFSQLAGTANVQPVATSAPAGDDPMHILWQGTLADAGTYYIVVQPTAGTEAQYLLTIGGRGLAPATDGGTISTGALNVNIRSGPSTAYPVLRTIAQGTELTVLGQDTSGAWLTVRLPDGTQGWIARFLTGFTGTVAVVPAPALALTPPQATTPPLAPPATTDFSGAVITGASNVNFRAGPSTAYPVIRTIPQGTQFTVLGQDATGTWLAVRLGDGTEGWVARFLTNFISVAPVATAPVVTTPPLAPPATTGSVAGAFNVNIRSGPSTAYAVLRTVSLGTELTVLGQDASGSWLLVRLSDGSQGWIACFLTAFTGTAPVVAAPPLAAVPIVSAPPLAPPATISVAPGPASLPSQQASVDNFPIEDALGNNWRILPAGQIHWFTFSDPGDEDAVQIWMDAEPTGSAEFRIYREEDAKAIMAGRNPDDFTDIGRGTFNENEPADLFWRGAFDEHGTYYVMVRSGASSDISYSLFGVGSSIGG
jgi:uncharacterized protein YgiM (DUF1202 family)